MRFSQQQMSTEETPTLSQPSRAAHLEFFLNEILRTKNDEGESTDIAS